MPGYTLHTGALIRSEALPMACTWHAKLLVEGTTDVEILPREGEVIFAKINGNIVGAIVFGHNEEDNVVWIYLSYVEPLHREAGIFKSLWNELVTQCRLRAVKKITGGTHFTNKLMQDVMEKLGRKKTYILYDFYIG